MKWNWLQRRPRCTTTTSFPLFLCFCGFPLAAVVSNDYNQGDTRSCGSVKIKKECNNSDAKCKRWKCESVAGGGGEGGGVLAFRHHRQSQSACPCLHSCTDVRRHKQISARKHSRWLGRLFCANFPREPFEHKYQPWQNSPGLRRGLRNQQLRLTTYSLLPRTGVHTSATVTQLLRKRSLWPRIRFIPSSIDKLGDCWQAAVTYELIVIQCESLLKPTPQMERRLLDLFYISVLEGVPKSRTS